MNITKAALLIFSAVLFYCCTSSQPEIRRNRFRTGDFNYTMTDSSGVKLAGGILKVDYVKGKDMSGTYTVIKDTSKTFEGHETMNNGPFSGHYNDSLSIAFFNLNPRMADANIFIFANDYSDSLKGDWYFSTFRGKGEINQKGELSSNHDISISFGTYRKKLNFCTGKLFNKLNVIFAFCRKFRKFPYFRNIFTPPGESFINRFYFFKLSISTGRVTDGFIIICISYTNFYF
jgi:hypothetical protein